MSILGKHSDRLIPLQGDRDVLSAGGLDAAGRRGFSELPGAGRGIHQGARQSSRNGLILEQQNKIWHRVTIIFFHSQGRRWRGDCND
ncbi:unnamed protein product [Sphagnum jensenii]|uniref:Uncharacterized protein n=1 Tax=Sphagnum jensenii TaxID=128206 RepID=A0ABP1A8U7_9BRYO